MMSGPTFRYHHLVRQVLRAELRARSGPRSGPAPAGGANGSKRPVTPGGPPGISWPRGRPTGRWTLLQDRVVPDFLRDPTRRARWI